MKAAPTATKLTPHQEKKKAERHYHRIFDRLFKIVEYSQNQKIRPELLFVLFTEFQHRCKLGLLEAGVKEELLDRIIAEVHGYVENIESDRKKQRAQMGGVA